MDTASSAGGRGEGDRLAGLWLAPEGALLIKLKRLVVISHRLYAFNAPSWAPTLRCW